jgi:hypothetical protein
MFREYGCKVDINTMVQIPISGHTRPGWLAPQGYRRFRPAPGSTESSSERHRRQQNPASRSVLHNTGPSMPLQPSASSAAGLVSPHARPGRRWPLLPSRAGSLPHRNRLVRAVARQGRHCPCLDQSSNSWVRMGSKIPTMYALVGARFVTFRNCSVNFISTTIPKEVRRRTLEASVRAPESWHQNAITAAYSSGDKDWILTDVFSMRWVRGFDYQILEALKSADPEIHYEACQAATGGWPWRGLISSHLDSTPPLQSPLWDGTQGSIPSRRNHCMASTHTPSFGRPADPNHDITE